MLEDYQPKALDIFERLYPELTAGAQFDRYASASLTEAFHDTAVSIKDAGFDGIIIIWDEFGRFMEAKSSDALAMMQLNYKHLPNFVIGVVKLKFT